MAATHRLITLLQISDLHFVAMDPATGNPIRSPAATRLWSNTAAFDGILGHHRRAMQHLHAFYKKLVHAGEEPRLLITGDLTSYGNGDQFDCVNDFLGTQVDLNPPKQNYVGLHVNDWLSSAIPGNHDRFPGTPWMFGGPTDAFATYFPTLPFVCEAIDLGGERKLIIAGIDSDADVGSWGRKRLLGRGSFRTQLAELQRMMEPPSDNEVRVLLVHDSYDHHGRILKMDSVSRNALGDFMGSENFKIMLTGHMHIPLIKEFASSPAADFPVLEARCGTTTQLDTIPLDWRTVFHTRPTRKLKKNTLIVHRIIDSGESLAWHSTGYVRKRMGFSPIGKPADHAMVVWP